MKRRISALSGQQRGDSGRKASALQGDQDRRLNRASRQAVAARPDNQLNFIHRQRQPSSVASDSSGSQLADRQRRSQRSASPFIQRHPPSMASMPQMACQPAQIPDLNHQRLDDWPHQPAAAGVGQFGVCRPRITLWASHEQVLARGEAQFQQSAGIYLRHLIWKRLAISRPGDHWSGEFLGNVSIGALQAEGGPGRRP